MTVAIRRLEASADPLVAIDAASTLLASMRRYMSALVEHERGGWLRALRADPACRELVLEQLAGATNAIEFAGALIALGLDPITELTERLADDRIELAVLRTLIAERVGARTAA